MTAREAVVHTKTLELHLDRSCTIPALCSPDVFEMSLYAGEINPSAYSIHPSDVDSFAANKVDRGKQTENEVDQFVG